MGNSNIIQDTGVIPLPIEDVDASGYALFEAATPLLACIPILRKVLDNKQCAPIQKVILSNIAVFEAQLQRAGIAPQLVDVARYCLCAAIDEAALCGYHSKEWARHTLVSQLYHQAKSGESVYRILDDLLEQPEANIDFLRLLYVLLNLGFTGKYYKAYALKDHLVESLYRKLSCHEPTAKVFTLSPQWKSYAPKKKWSDVLPVWVVALLVFSFLLFFSLMEGRLYQRDAQPVIDRLDNVAQTANHFFSVDVVKRNNELKRGSRL